MLHENYALSSPEQQKPILSQTEQDILSARLMLQLNGLENVLEALLSRKNHQATFSIDLNDTSLPLYHISAFPPTKNIDLSLKEKLPTSMPSIIPIMFDNLRYPMISKYFDLYGSNVKKSKYSIDSLHNEIRIQIKENSHEQITAEDIAALSSEIESLTAVIEQELDTQALLFSHTETGKEMLTLGAKRVLNAIGFENKDNQIVPIKNLFSQDELTSLVDETIHFWRLHPDQMRKIFQQISLLSQGGLNTRDYAFNPHEFFNQDELDELFDFIFTPVITPDHIRNKLIAKYIAPRLSPKSLARYNRKLAQKHVARAEKIATQMPEDGGRDKKRQLVHTIPFSKDNPDELTRNYFNRKSIQISAILGLFKSMYLPKRTAKDAYNFAWLIQWQSKANDLHYVKNTLDTVSDDSHINQLKNEPWYSHLETILNIINRYVVSPESDSVDQTILKILKNELLQGVFANLNTFASILINRLEACKRDVSKVSDEISETISIEIDAIISEFRKIQDENVLVLPTLTTPDGEFSPFPIISMGFIGEIRVQNLLNDSPETISLDELLGKDETPYQTLDTDSDSKQTSSN